LRTCWWFPLVRRSLIGLAAGALAACAEQAEPPAQPSRAPASAPVPQMPTQAYGVPRPAHKPPPPAENPPAEADREGLALVEPKPPQDGGAVESSPSPTVAPPVSGSPRPNAAPPAQIELIGLDQPAAMRLFGSAAERSDEPPATVWRYKNGSCELELYFYLDLRSGSMRTLHYMVKGASDEAKRQDCLRSLLASRSG
jgi:hypothetical protein